MAYPKNKLPYEFLDLNEMTTASRGVVALYGRRVDGTLVAIQVDDNGLLASSASFTGGSISISDPITPANSANIVLASGLPNALATRPTGSVNSFFADQATLATTLAFQQLTFGFTSISITLINDDSTKFIEFSFDGVNVHGRLKVSNGLTMDYRSQSSIWIRSSAAAANYRLIVY
jgi:hypothetical protein